MSVYSHPAVTANAQTHTSLRSARQHRVNAWCAEAFGSDHAASVPERALRLIEEALEAAQAAGINSAMAHRLVDHVYSRPTGELEQELGGVGLTLLALASAAGLDADHTEQQELDRVLSKPASHFTARNAAKIAAGLSIVSAHGTDVDTATLPMPADLHPRTADLIRRFAVALGEKLAVAERKYGWDTHWESPAWMDQCREQLVAHVAKGDPRDVAAYSAFLWHHGESTALPGVPAPEGYYLASFKQSAHGGEILWWGADNCGYTPDLEQAGVYTQIHPGYHDNGDTVPVPVRFIETLRVRRMVDPGDSLNRCMWNAVDLRAAVVEYATTLPKETM